MEGAWRERGGRWMGIGWVSKPQAASIPRFKYLPIAITRGKQGTIEIKAGAARRHEYLS